MLKDVLSQALIQSMVAGLSVPDLIRTTETFKQSGQLASVEAAYAAWVASHPQDPLLYAVLFNYSVALTDSGKILEAQQALEQAIGLSPDFMPAYINLGRVLERQPHSEDTRAIQQLNLALKHDERVDYSLLPLGDGMSLCRTR